MISSLTGLLAKDHQMEANMEAMLDCFTGNLLLQEKYMAMLRKCCRLKAVQRQKSCKMVTKIIYHVALFQLFLDDVFTGQSHIISSQI